MRLVLLNLYVDYPLLGELDAFQLFSEGQITVDELPQDSELFTEMNSLSEKNTAF